MSLPTIKISLPTMERVGGHFIFRMHTLFQKLPNLEMGLGITTNKQFLK